MTHRIGLALGGGGARGFAHIHVLRALDDLGVKPFHLAGSSIGSIMAAGYAAGMDGTDIEAYVLDTFASSSTVFSKIWQIRPGPFRAWMGAGGPVFAQFDVETILEAFLPPQLPDKIEELDIRTSITATDYYANELTVIDTGRLCTALGASAAIPILFKPVVVDGTVLIDGGIANPLPFDLLDPDCTATIGVDVVGLPRGEAGTIPGRRDMAFGTSQLMMQSVTNLKLKLCPPDLFLRPPVDDFRVLDFIKVRSILETTKPVYEQAKRGIDTILERSSTVGPD